uniref:Reelin domain-containing protein n=1 Tax=Romanomermis culicivorax TaxID=13658 RepID=A0A915HUC5_ROMCU
GLFCVNVFYFFSIFSDPSFAYPFDVPCSSFDTFKPNAIFHGPGIGLAEIDGDLRDYEFRILDKNGVLVGIYDPGEVYTVQLHKRSGFFRGFLIQARAVQPFSNNRDGSLMEKIGHKRVGHFISDTTWPDQGIQYQSCEDDDQLDSVMHLNSRIKRKIEVRWKTDGTDDVQFLPGLFSIKDNDVLGTLRRIATYCCREFEALLRQLAAEIR